jgi:CRP-like cAMP-binding protein
VVASVLMDVEELGRVPLFSDLPEEDLRAVATYADEVSVSEGKHLVDEGGYAYDLFAIMEGTAQVVAGGEVVAELGPGDFFGEAGVLEKQQRNATVVAKTRMRLVTLTGWDLRRMRRQLGPVMEKLERAIEERRQPIAEG